ncbi:PTS sugar transporter subunit IIC [Lapidilactobacillus achengensis]|uniref:Permease IIC component n=1 Tax=Lapidilactobacillus achengensis TaxID=2486000 RepID=A0ABW1UKL1_9LACO|nr:PTS sugar transporter subunit IIC [Lapidilactobacillus achengensis]
MNDWINKHILPGVMRFVATRPIKALQSGMLYVMPFTIIGSIFLLLGNLPVESWKVWMESTGMVPYWNVAYNASFAIMALFAVIGIAYSYVREEGFEPLPAGLLAATCFLMVMRPSNPVTVGDKTLATAAQMAQTTFIDRDWLGGKGMIASILIGLIVGAVYSWFLKKNFTIKMPEQVPANVSASFTALIPAAVLITGFMLVYLFFDKVTASTMTEWIYKVIQTPLQGLTDSFGGMLAIAFLVPFLWFFGVHGATIVGGIMGPLLQANALANQKILDAGKALTVANGGHIVTQQLMDQFMTVTGSGMTIGLLIFMFFFAKSAQWKTLGRLSIAPGIFNINEPILFAAPIVLNPIMGIPFFLAPMASATLTWIALRLGWIPLFGGTMVAWTTPPIISGFLVGGVRTALWQALMLFITFLIYLPFARKQDTILYKQEQGESDQEIEADEAK